MSDRKDEKIRCDACPVMCYIADGKSGACDRYANHDGQIVRLDPLTILDRRMAAGDSVKPFLGANWDGGLGQENEVFVTAIGAGTTYPDYKPAPFIVSREVDGVDFVTVVTEAIFSYCGVKVKSTPTGILARRARWSAAAARRSGLSSPRNTARRCSRSAAWTI